MKQMTPRTDACHEGRRELYLGGTVDYAFAAQLETELNETKAALEREQLRLAACGVVAMADTPESAAEARNMKPEYDSASCFDVARRVDECIALRQMVRELLDALENIVSVGCEFYDMDMGDNGAAAIAQAESAMAEANLMII